MGVIHPWDNFPEVQFSSEPIVRRANIRGERGTGDYLGAIIRGNFPSFNYLGGLHLGGNCPGAIFIGGNCPGGSHAGGNCLSGNYPGGSFPLG